MHCVTLSVPLRLLGVSELAASTGDADDLTERKQTDSDDAPFSDQLHSAIFIIKDWVVSEAT